MTEEELQCVNFLKIKVRSQLLEDKSWNNISFTSSNMWYELDRVLTAIILEESNLKLRLTNKNGKKRKFNLNIQRILYEIENSEIDRMTLINIGSLKPPDPTSWKYCFSYKVSERKDDLEGLTLLFLLLLFYILPCLIFGFILSKGIIQELGLSFENNLASGFLMFFFAFIIAKGLYSIHFLRKFGKIISKVNHLGVSKLVELIM